MKTFLFLGIFFIPIIGFAQIPSGYYNTATGSGYILKTQLYNKIKGHTNNGYTALWTIFGYSDRDIFYENDNTVLDIYSENPNGIDAVSFVYGTNQCGSYTTQGNCYNREHIIPQSIFNSASPMQSDAHFIIPVDGYVNGIRSDNPHGEVAVTTWTSWNGSKRGTSAVAGYTGTVFEPLNEFKGDIARMYFYFVTRYENLMPAYIGYPMFNGTSDTSFTNGFLAMLMNWHNQDPVSVRETVRNDAIYVYQGNRNPFIDHPEYVGYIWGGTAVNLTQTIMFNSIADGAYGNPNFSLAATASSGLPITYTSSNTNVATINGSIVSIVGVGSTTITASQLGDSVYLPAQQVSQTFTVNKAEQIIVFAPLASKIIGDAPFNLTATGGASNNPVIYSSSNTSVASIIGNVVTIVGVGITNITASQIGNTNYANAIDVVRSLTVSNGIIAAWNFSNLPGGTGTNNYGISPYLATYNNLNTTVGGLTRGNGIGASSTSNAAARAWGGTINTANAQSAINSNTAITFTLKANNGYAMDFGSLNPIDYRRSATGATNGLVQYQVDGGVFNDIATLNFTSTASSGASAGIINLSTIAELQNIHATKTITIRILPYGGTGGSFYFFDRNVSTNYDLAVLGNVRSCMPSSSSSAITIASSATPFIWHGQNLLSSGTYMDTIINSLGCDSIVTLNLTVLPSSVIVTIKAFVQGFYIGNNTMNSVLFNAGIIGVGSNDCDTMTIELHNSNFPYSLVFNSKQVLQTNGLMTFNLPFNYIGNSYYLVLKNRNSIETWSAIPQLINANTNYDFSFNANQAFGANEIEIEPNVYAIFSGDINQDGILDVGDYSIWESDANNFANGYMNSDLDGDGAVSTSDYSLWEGNANIFVGIVIP